MPSRVRKRSRPLNPPAFSLVELVIVVVILGIIAAIAIPRMSSATSRSRATAIRADLRVLTDATDHYAAEHADRTPAIDQDGKPETDGTAFAQRLTMNTDDLGTVKTGIFGPYIRAIPLNINNGLDTIRIDGPAAGANTHGWRYDTATREYAADDSVQNAQIKAWDAQLVGAVLEAK